MGPVVGIAERHTVPARQRKTERTARLCHVGRAPDDRICCLGASLEGAVEQGVIVTVHFEIGVNYRMQVPGDSFHNSSTRARPISPCQACLQPVGRPQDHRASPGNAGQFARKPRNRKMYVRSKAQSQSISSSHSTSPAPEKLADH